MLTSRLRSNVSARRGGGGHVRGEVVLSKTACESTKLLRRTEPHASGGRCLYLEDSINTMMASPDRPLSLASRRRAARQTRSLTAETALKLPSDVSTGRQTEGSTRTVQRFNRNARGFRVSHCRTRNIVTQKRKMGEKKRGARGPVQSAGETTFSEQEASPAS